MSDHSMITLQCCQHCR